MDYKYNDDFQFISATDAAERKNIRIQPVNIDDVSAGIGNPGDTGNIIKVIGVCTKSFKKSDGSDDTASRTAYTGLGTA